MHFLSAKRVNPENLQEIFSLASRMQDGETYSLQGKIIATIFHERSTRTRLSFESAAIRLGASVITENDCTSSSGKGESIYDTLRTVSQYADAIVLRTAARLQEDLLNIGVPIISAGDGENEHPTQAILDLYTIHRELGLDRKMRLLMIGDLLASRTVRSLMHVLRPYAGIEVLAAPSPLYDYPTGYRLYDSNLPHILERKIEIIDLKNQCDEILPEVDVVYITRRQVERHRSEYGSGKSDFVFGEQHLKLLKPSALIMHPMPRCRELCTSVDGDPRAVFHTKQIKNGLYVRMAILYLACAGWFASQTNGTKQ